MTTLGIDAGIGGALALLGPDSLVVMDMPTLRVKVGKSERQRIDMARLALLFQYWELIADRIVMEQVAARPGDSGMFNFGMTYGILYTHAFNTNLRVEQVPSQTWKRVLRVPGKTEGTSEAIVQRADELMPLHRMWWRGPRGGALVDRAEAAMLAYYGEHYL